MKKQPVMEDWQRIAWEKHRVECKRAKLQDIHLYGHGVSISPTTLDAMLQDRHQDTQAWTAMGQQAQSQHGAHDEHQPTSSSKPLEEDSGQNNQKEKKDDSAFAATERIVAGQCTCCNTLFQLEILEKVGTIQSADVELRKLQNSIPTQQKETYGARTSGTSVDYAPRTNEEVKITYTAGSSSTYTDSATSGNVQYSNDQSPSTEYK